MLDDVLIGNVGTVSHRYHLDQAIPGWNSDGLIGNEGDFDAKSFGGAKDEFLRIAWCRIGINP
jgi:hypothetical protein